MSKPETSFRLGVEKYLPSKKEPHREKMNNPYRGGTADSWYSGKAGDLWVEYKFLPCKPQRGDITPKRLDLSALQLDWLRGRYEEGRKVAVIVGCPEGGVVLTHLAWEATHSVEQFLSLLKPRKLIAMWIRRYTLGW